ncbi:DUF1735 domain-containing protein [Haliscomenobacter sp.]|uniref:DUF1735 domain-containing protein n=1 Tax=Haliscomenobacter sp. TaxID=2717303 RepID=UPI00359379B6
MKIFKYIPLMLLGGALSFLGCEDEVVNPIEGKGDNFVRIPEGVNDLNLVALDVVPGVKTLRLLDLLRDANSESSLGSSLGIKMKIDKAALDAFNAAHPAEAMEELPASLYTTDALEFTLGAGEFAKSINIKLDPTKLDLTKRYGIAVSVVDASGHKVRNGQGSAVFNIVAKNQYDGIYEVTGTMVDNASAALTGLFPVKYALITLGPGTVEGNDVELGLPAGRGIGILSSGSTSYYGSFSPIFELDPATNKVIKVTNFFGQPAGNTRSAELDPSGVNQYDPATKSLEVKFFMIQPSSIPAPPHVRVVFDWKMKYVGSR